VCVEPETGVLWRDAAVGLDRGGFQDGEARLGRGALLLAGMLSEGGRGTLRRGAAGEEEGRRTPRWTMPPRWVLCHGVWKPSWALYWHMGLTMMRFCIVMPRILRGEKSLGMGCPFG
jgi:hypothetical protein